MGYLSWILISEIELPFSHFLIISLLPRLVKSPPHCLVGSYTIRRVNLYNTGITAIPHSFNPDT